MNELGVRSETVNRVWTGTANGGAVSPFTCDDWTNGTNRGKGMIGIGGQVAEWTQLLEESCDHQESLYCFEVK